RAWFRSSAGELASLAEQGESLFGQLARLAPIWVIVDYDVERMLAKRGKNAGRVAEAHCLFVLSQKTFQQVVYGQVAGRARQHLLATTRGLPDQFDNGCRFASAWRTVHYCYVLCRESKAHGLLL